MAGDTMMKTARKRPPSRTTRWAEACARASAAIDDLIELQEEYAYWHDNLPENLQSSTVAEKLATVCDIDFEAVRAAIDDADNADLPLGFGRD